MRRPFCGCRGCPAPSSGAGRWWLEGQGESVNPPFPRGSSVPLAGFIFLPLPGAGCREQHLCVKVAGPYSERRGTFIFNPSPEQFSRRILV